jgi:hypothetical protein
LARTPPFAGFWHVQSWLNGDVRPFGHTDRCDNILQVRLPDGAPYQTTRDHAKWGVHADCCLAVVGDLNRTQTWARLPACACARCLGVHLSCKLGSAGDLCTTCAQREAGS